MIIQKPLTNEVMHRDHQSWEKEVASWRDELQLWQKELLQMQGEVEALHVA